MVVRPEPACDKILYFSGRVEQIMAQPITTDCSVVVFDVGILLWLARLNVPQLNAVLLVSLPLVYSGPWSHLMALGWPLRSINRGLLAARSQHH